MGGNLDDLNPALIHLNVDGSTAFERCQTGKYGRRFYSLGNFLDNRFVICGGTEKDLVPKNDCEVIGKSGSQSFKMISNSRVAASSVKLNESTMWITGGYDPTIQSFSQHLNSTELVTINGTTAGISMPITAIGHCMVQYKPNKILLIGGLQNYAIMDKTWIIDTSNAFDMKEGPVLNVGRYFHFCGKAKDKYGNVIVFVAGGYVASTEFLNTTTMKEWIKGRT